MSTDLDQSESSSEVKSVANNTKTTSLKWGKDYFSKKNPKVFVETKRKWMLRRQPTNDHYIPHTPRTHYSIPVVAHMIFCFTSDLFGYVRLSSSL